MSKFRAMVLKVEDGSPSPLASTSITLDDQPSTSPSKGYVESEIRNDPIITSEAAEPYPLPFDDVRMGDEDQVPNDMQRSPKAEDPLHTKSEPSRSTSPTPSPKLESTPPAQKKLLKKGPQLIDHLPIASEEAMRTFIQIQENQYHDDSRANWVTVYQ